VTDGDRLAVDRAVYRYLVNVIDTNPEVDDADVRSALLREFASGETPVRGATAALTAEEFSELLERGISDRRRDAVHALQQADDLRRYLSERQARRAREGKPQ
jgi:hypothetical protein